MDKHLNILIQDLKEVLHDRLTSVILYGSSAAEDELKNAADINLIVIINKITAQDLKNCSSAVKKWLKTKNPAPVFMGKVEWSGSCDVYPMEYSDIKQRHKILYGENIVSELILDKEHLRLQCESTTKNLLIRLRQAYLLNNADKIAVTELISIASRDFTAIFRTILRLLNENIPDKKEEIISLISKKIDINEEMFKKILLFRENKKVFDKNELETVIQTLIDSIYEVLKYVDKMEINKEEKL